MKFDIFGTPTSQFSVLDEWRFANFGTYENSGEAADNFDADSDGLSNLLEYATGLNPNDSGDSQVIRFGESATNPGEPEVSFNRIADPALTYTLQGSATLREDDWDTLTSTTGSSEGSIAVPQSSWPDTDNYFFRLNVTY